MLTNKSIKRLKMNKTLLSIFLIAFAFITVSAQQQSQYTQYMYNQMAYNPAYAGSQESTIVFGHYRTQWVGLDGAPKTGSFSINSPISEMGHGLGISIINDEIGPTTTTGFDVNLSYALEMENSDMFYFGIKGGGTNLEVNYTVLKLLHPDSELTGVLSQFSPTIGAGVYYQSDQWYAGLAIPNFLQTKFFDDVKQSLASTRMHYYLHGGYIFDINENLLFKPAGVLKAVSGAPLSFDLSANFLINETFTIGAAYRVSSALSGLVAFKISESATIGYSYDYETTSLSNYSRGSHEFFLKFNLKPLVRTYAGKNCWCN